MFNYKEITAAGSINNYIRKFWVLDHSTSPLYSDAKYALPNGCFTIAFISGGGVILESAEKKETITSGIYLIGQITKRLKVVVKPYSKAIMVQLPAWSPSLITKFPLSELTGQLVGFGMVNKALHKAFSNIDITDEHLLISRVYMELENYLYESHDSSFIKNTIRLFTANLTDTPLKISDIALNTGYSKRYVEKKFNLLTGLSPKEMYSILRMRSLVHTLHKSDNEMSLTKLGFEFGYFDQSHFIKAYTNIMGSLPKKFSAQEYILPVNF